MADLCPQCNFTELLLGDFRPKVNIYDALKPKILGSAFGDVPEELSYRVSQYCSDFKGGKGAWVISGNPELFAFPDVPKIAAIVMTMVGSKSQKEATPDNASKMYIERAIGFAEEYATLFHHKDPSDAFVITDDFHSAGRISGAERKPITELQIGKFHTVEGRRLQVNASAERYKKQLRYLASMI